jgi:hypothetical protein
MKTLAMAALAAASSHAIIGFGGQWAPALGLKVEGSNGAIAQISGTDSISIRQGSVEGLNGFGLKLWIDVLPFIDIEATTNFQYGLYDVTIVGPGTTETPVKFDLGVPVLDKPGFARSVNDLTILYPFLTIPPVVNILKLYAGAGVTFVASTAVLDAGFSKKAVAKATAGGNQAAADTPQEVADILIDAIQDEGMNTGFGFHLEAGAKVKPPIIPLAAFLNLKYHFLSSMPSAVDANSLTLEVGGALDF